MACNLCLELPVKQRRLECIECECNFCKKCIVIDESDVFCKPCYDMLHDNSDDEQSEHKSKEVSYDSDEEDVSTCEQCNKPCKYVEISCVKCKRIFCGQCLPTIPGFKDVCFNCS